MRFRFAFTLMTLGVVLLSFGPAAGQDPLGYKLPSVDLVALIDADDPPWVSLSPDHERMLLLRVPNLPSIEELSEEELRLAGYRIKPATNGPSRGSTRRGSGMRSRPITRSISSCTW